MKKGSISVETQNIFPVIKRWLYSEKDIFLREIVSNATDAITKMKRLQSLGQIEAIDDNYRVDVILDKDEKTITVSDNGIGMSEEELTKYICQIALSGAVDFIQKYEDKNDSSAGGIIGHFGLGFYSAFMVSEKVEIITKSYTDAPAVHWSCSDADEYQIETTERPEGRGTTIIMHIASDEEEYLNAFKLEGILNKYCAFMPVEIFFREIKEQDEAKEEKPLNDTMPLWLKSASECTPEDYNAFYKKVFADYKDPLFYIHINADYPLNFKGILFFPNITNDFESLEGQVKLYYNQVFVADNIKEVIPEYMLMLKGVLDCPELPLNVSRSYLQTNTYVSKVSAHIVKKVADKLNSLCNTDRENYEKIWEGIKVFVEYACIRDRKFYDRVKDSLLLKLTDNSHVTVTDYLASAKDKHENTIYYTSDKALQARYISLFEEQGIQVASFEKAVETQFLSALEQNMENIKFVRVDADLASALKAEETTEENEDLVSLFRKASKNENLKVKSEALKSTKTPAILNLDENARRFEDMMRMYNNAEMPTSLAKEGETLVLNTSSPLITKLTEDLKSQNNEHAEKLAAHIYRLSLISQRRLTAEEMQEFLDQSFSLLEEL
ncbi:MAG: molecular chaperone HtpG [Clostridia bacterium]|nr:molecular chaperone HtpG [Clostridia bacterium]